MERRPTPPSSRGRSHSPPLVVAVDVPDDPLHKDLVLVHGWKQKNVNHHNQI